MQRLELSGAVRLIYGSLGVKRLKCIMGYQTLTFLIQTEKVKWSRYRPGVAQRVGRGIALLFHDRGTRRGWVVSSTPRLNFTPGKDSVPILQEAGWAPGPVWTGGKSRPYWDSILDRPSHGQSLYRLSYRAHNILGITMYRTKYKCHYFALYKQKIRF